MAITINVSIDDKEVRKTLELLQKRVRNLRPAMQAIGETVRTSVIKNFMSAGSPDKWWPSERAKKEGGKTLTDKARLRNSITPRAYNDMVVIGTKFYLNHRDINLSMCYNSLMSFFKWMLIIFVAPIPVMLGILLSIPLVIAGGIVIIIALLLPPIFKSLKNRLHPLRRKHLRPSSWHQWR